MIWTVISFLPKWAINKILNFTLGESDDDFDEWLTKERPHEESG